MGLCREKLSWPRAWGWQGNAPREWWRFGSAQESISSTELSELPLASLTELLSVASSQYLCLCPEMVLRRWRRLSCVHFWIWSRCWSLVSTWEEIWQRLMDFHSDHWGESNLASVAKPEKNFYEYRRKSTEIDFTFQSSKSPSFIRKKMSPTQHYKSGSSVSGFIEIGIISSFIRFTLLKKGLVTPRMIAGSAEELLEVSSLKSTSWMV